MKRPYFQKRSGVNQDIILIDDIRNIGFSNQKLWWAEIEGGTPDGYLYVKSATSITALTVDEDSRKTSGAFVWTAKNAVLRTYGDLILAAGCFIDPTLLVGNIAILHSSDGGVSFTSVVLSAGNLELYDTIYQDIKKMFIYYNHVTSTIQFRDMVAAYPVYDSLALTDENAMYPGIVRDDLYYFVVYDGADFLKYSFDAALGASAIVLVETYIGISTPLSFDFKRQLYYFIGDVEVLIDNTYFRWRDPINGVWQFYSVSVATNIVAAIWSHNYLNEYVIPTWMWDKFILEMSDKGVLKKIQALEPRDYKKVYLSNTNENVPGNIQFLNQNGDDDLRAWAESGTVEVFTVVDSFDGAKNVAKLTTVAILGREELNFTAISSADFEFYTGQSNTVGTTLQGLAIGTTFYAGIRLVGGGTWGYYTNTSFVAFPSGKTYVANTKYHVRIKWVSNTSLEIWVDDVKEVDIVVNIYNGTLARFLWTVNGTLDSYLDALKFSWDGGILGSTKKINAYVGYSALKNSWDHKLTFLTNDAITGIQQWGTASDPDLGDWILITTVDNFSVVSLLNMNENVLTIEDTGLGRYKLLTGNLTVADFEFLLSQNNTTGTTIMGLSQNDSTNQASIRLFAGGAFYYSTNGTLVPFISGKTYDADIIYHCRIKWVSNVSLEIWVDDVKEVNIVADIYNGTLTEFLWVVNACHSTLDSLGFNKDKYVSGSNNEFPLLTFEKPWFATGDIDTGIMQLALKDYDTGTRKTLVQTELYKAPECSLDRTTEPFEDEWAKLCQNDGPLFYGGKVKDNNNDNRFTWIYLMKSWQDEFAKTKINELLVDYTYKTMWEFLIDKYSKYLWYGPGTNGNVNEFTPNQISGKDDDWTNLDDANCESTYQVQKAFTNGFLYNVLQEYDNNNAGNGDVGFINQSFLVFSYKVVLSDVTKDAAITFYEGATRIGIMRFSDRVLWYDGAYQEIPNTSGIVDNEIVHICGSINITDDTIDIYVNGAYKSTENLENNITLELTKCFFQSWSSAFDFYTYYAQFYRGNSLIDAMHTFSSISPLLTETKTFDLKNQSLIGEQKSTAKETGYIVSVRPTGQMYIDQYGASGKSINANESNGITFQSKMQIRNEKFSLITFYGGFVNGIQIVSEGFGEPNFGDHEGWFPEINGKDPDDIYYDADGKPKSHRLDAMVTDALVRMNIRIKKQLVGKRGDGMFHVGTSKTYNNDHYKVSNETWNLWRKNIYNGKTDDNRVEIADSYLSPSDADPDADPISKVTRMIDVNAEDITKNSQSVGYLAERVRSRDIIDIYLEENARNLDQSVLGLFQKEVDAGVLNSGSPLNPTIGRHRVMFVIIAASDFSGTITITGDTVNRTDSSDVTVGDTEDITIDSLSTDNTSADAESNDIHKFLNVFISDKWFQGSIVISTTDLTITDIDVYAILYHQFDSYKLITLDTLDFTAKTTNASAWFYQYLYLVSCVNANKKYDIENIVAQGIAVGTTVANKGYRARNDIDRLIDGNAGHGIWLELFFGPVNLTYWNDIFIILSALLDSGTN